MKYALRRLVTTPIFTATALLTLGLALGANGLIFSVVNGVLLKPLPFADPERLVGVWHVAPGLMSGDLNMSPATYFAYREDGVFQDIGMWDNGAASVTGRGEPERVDTLSVTDGTLPLLGVQPALGRLFSAADDTPGSAATLMLTRMALTVALSRVPSTSRPVTSNAITAAGTFMMPPTCRPLVNAAGMSTPKDLSTRPTK